MNIRHSAIRVTRSAIPFVFALALPLGAAHPGPARIRAMAGSHAPAEMVGESGVLVTPTGAGANAPKWESAPEPGAEGTAAPSGEGVALVSAGTYAFSALGGVALEDMSTGTTQLVGPNLDDTASPVTNIGFDFWYDGVRFTQFSVNSNGLCKLGPVAITTSFDNASATTGFATTTNAPKIAPYYDDLWTGTNGKVHFKVLGSAPSRKLVVEWLNEQIPRVATGNPGAGTFQMWLFETSGVIEFVYGTGIAVNTTNTGYTIGLQSGAATNFASVTSATATVDYVTANNTQTGAIPAGTAYTFTPNVPAAPTDLAFTGTAVTATTLNWTDNASNEVGYAIYRSGDGGVSYAFVAQIAANSVAYPDSGLFGPATYHYRVFAITEGSLGAAVSASVTTLAPTANASLGSGLWSNPATWSTGAVPTLNDAVTIADGHTISVDTAAAAYSLTVGTGGAPAILEFDAAAPFTLAVGNSVTVAANGALQTPASGTVTGHLLSVGGDLTNNGIINFSTNGNTAGAALQFNSATNNAFGGSGATNLRTLTLNKGSGTVTAASPVLDVTLANGITFGVFGSTTVGVNQTLYNGILKFSGTAAWTNRLFGTPAYTIPATGGLWLNNPNFSVDAQNGSPTLSGLLRVSQGAFNVGTAAGSSMGFSTGSTVIIEGGAVTASSRFGVAAAANVISYTQSGGVITVCTIGNASTTLASFDLGATSGSTIAISGGAIVVQMANTALSGPRDYRHQAGNGLLSVTGGTLQLGNEFSGAAKNFFIAGVMPNFVLTNTSGNHTATTQAPAIYVNSMRDITINAGNTLTLANNTNAHLFLGTAIVNNGAIVGGTSSRFDFAGGAPMTYGGSGTFGTALVMFGGSIGSNSSFPITLNAPIVTPRVNLFRGGFVNSNQITLGNGGASTTVVQVGAAGVTTPGGSFDVSPNHQQGTGGQVLIYAAEGQQRTTSFEINPTRIANRLTLDNVNGLILGGGDLSVFSVAASPSNALTLTNGRLITGSNTITLTDPASVVVRTSGFVDGALRKSFSAIGSKPFEVGTLTGYAPVTVNATAGTFPAPLIVRSQAGKLPALAAHNAISRHWTLTGTGITADLTFQYLLADVQGNETNYSVIKHETGTLTVPAGQSVNAGAHTGSAPGVSSFSDWTVGEAPVTLLRDDQLATLNPSPAVLAAIFLNSPADPAMGASSVDTTNFFSGGNYTSNGPDYSNTTKVLIFYQTNTPGSNSLRVTKDIPGARIVITY